MSDRASDLAGWCSAHGVRLCVLFGSRADGRARTESDYDLAMLPGATPTPAERLDWQVQLEALLLADVSLVLLSGRTDPVLGWEIARLGRLIYEAQPGIWMHERLRRWHLNNDALPFRAALAESLRRYAEEVRHAS